MCNYFPGKILKNHKQFTPYLYPLRFLAFLYAKNIQLFHNNYSLRKGAEFRPAQTKVQRCKKNKS